MDEKPKVPEGMFAVGFALLQPEQNQVFNSDDMVAKADVVNRLIHDLATAIVLVAGPSQQNQASVVAETTLVLFNKVKMVSDEIRKQIDPTLIAESDASEEDRDRAKEMGDAALARILKGAGGVGEA